jgi:hypothetical protein
MKIGTACAIFLQINSEKYTDEEKGTAILEVLKMPTHNGISKSAMVVNGRKCGRTTDYMKDGKGYPLNYCPSCGKRVKNE